MKNYLRNSIQAIASQFVKRGPPGNICGVILDFGENLLVAYFPTNVYSVFVD